MSNNNLYAVSPISTSWEEMANYDKSEVIRLIYNTIINEHIDRCRICGPDEPCGRIAPVLEFVRALEDGV